MANNETDGLLPLQYDEQEVSAKVAKLQEWILNRDSTELNFSYSFLTTNFQRLPIYGKRLVYKLLEYAHDKQAFLGQKLDADFQVGKWADDEVTLDVRDLLASTEDSNYKAVKEYIKGLMETVTEETNSKGDVRLSHFIQDCDLTRAGKIVLRINRKAWEALLDFTKGFERGELEVLFQCEGEYTPLAYLLFACQKPDRTLNFGIDKLRLIFCPDEKDGRTRYKNNWDFIKYVIEPPMKELENFSPVTYTFTTNLDKDFEGNIVKSGKRGRPGLEQLQFHSKRLLKNDNTVSLQKQISVKSQLNDRVYEVFTHKLGFSTAEMRSNIQLITELQKLDLEAFLEFLDRNVPDFVRAENVQAYTIGSLKNYYKSLRQKKANQAATAAAIMEQQNRGGDAKSIGDLIGNF